MNVLDQLVDQLRLEKLEENLFRGQTQDLGWGAVFGGHVLGQALSAATQTVPSERRVHSMHAYFLRPGDVTRPILYTVDRIRDGASFTTRRVVAVQKGEPIFNLAASFQQEEPGFDHAEQMPEAPAPESLPDDRDRLQAMAEQLPPTLRKMSTGLRPIELRAADTEDHPLNPSKREPYRRVWIRARGTLGDDQAVHNALLAYASDYSFITTSLMPHGITYLTPKMQVASLDHVMWFHRPFRIDDWLLHVMESPSATNARGLVQGKVFTRAGVLVASTCQEGLIRQRK